MFGDLPADKMNELLNSKYRLEYFQDAKNFVFNRDTQQIEYKTNYDHIPAERLLPKNIGKCDGNILAELTTWTPANPLKPACGVVDPQRDTQEIPDCVDYIFSTMFWHDVSN